MKKKHPHRGAPSRGLAFESLESRLLLSADCLPAPDVLATGPSLVPAEHRALEALDPAPGISMRLEAHELTFIDGSIADRDRLFADFMRATGPDRAIEVVVLDPSRDGIAQIGEALAARNGLTAVHVLSHGRDGAIDLGATTLDAATLAERADAIAGWAGAFAADGDLLLFGCDVADSVRGEAFLGELARLTGADVAASGDPTGDAARGGDWDLEFATGAIEVALAPLADAAWGGVLATEVLDWDDPAIDWPAATIGANSYPVGGANVTVTVTDPAVRLNNNSPDDDALTDEGGLGAIEQGLYVSSTGFLAGESSTITIDFAHPGGVSNASFTIFDIDTGGGANFIDEIQASFTAGGTVTLSIVNGPNNTVIGGDTVQGTASTPSNGANSGDANATFTFTGSGITQISLNYRNVGGATGQSVTLHDISFDPTPTASNRTVTTNEDATYTFAAGDFGFADVGGDTLQAVRITQLETAGSLQLNGVDVVLNQVIAIADITANLLTFTPAANANGAPYADFRFRVGDGASFSVADYQMRVDVTPMNDAPVLAGANDFGAIAEDLVANAGTAVSALIAAQLTDADAGALAGIAVTAVDNANGVWEYSTDGGGSWTAFGAPSAGAALLLRDADLVRFAPVADWNGAATLSFRGWDRTSGAPGGTADTNANGGTTAFSLAVRTSSIAVTAVGDTVNDAAGTNEDVPVTVDVLLNDSFENAGRTLTAVAGAASGTVGFTAAGAITYTANADWNGTETLTYTVTSGGVTETGTLTIAVAAVGDTVNDQATVDEDNATTVNVLADDNFESAGRTLTAVSAAANGGVGFTAAGAVTYTPNVHWSGAEVLTYTVTSGGVTETGTFTITVTPVADAPTLTVNAAAGNEDTAIALTVASALVDADGSETLAITVSSIPVGATLSSGANAFTATAGNTTATITGWNLATLTVLPPLHSDVDFTLVVASTATEGANGAVATTNANLAVTVNAVADAPTLTVNAAAGNEDTAIALSVATGLVDTDGSESLAITVSSIPIGATLSSGASTFTATAGNTTATITGWNLATLTVLPPLHSDVDFTLVVASTATEGANGAVATTSANLAVTVNAVADAPTLTVNPAAGNEDTAIPLTVASGLVDTDGSETLSLTVSSIPIGATISSGANTFTATAGNTTATITGWNLATLTVLPPLHSDVDFSLTVTATATEGAGGAMAATVDTIAVTVGAVADAPTLSTNAAAGNEDTAIGLSIATALVDTDGSETLAVTVSSIPIGATLSSGANTFTATAGNTAATITGWNLATLTVLPPLHTDADFTLVVASTATEGANGAVATTSANLVVTVNAVADAPTLTVNAASGNEDSAIGLSVATALVDTDGSETLSLTVSSIPIGATLSSGANTFTATAGNTTATITGWNLAGLTVLPPLHSDVDFTLAIAATATEGANGAVATTSANLAVTVNAVADAPTLTVNAASGNEDTAIALTVASALVDADGSETLAITVSSIPVGATLSSGANTFTATAGNTTAAITGWNLATLTVLPPLHSDVDFTLTVTATATEGAGGATAVTVDTIAVTVGAVADAPTLTVNAAAWNEDTAIALSVASALVDADGSETLAITVSSIPVGATLASGANTFTATAGNTTATITGWNLAGLTVLPPLHSDVDFTLVVASAATEGANGASATTNANLAVTVNAVADAPTLTVNAAAGNEDTAIALTVATALVDTDGSETLAITVSSIPIGATIFSGANTFTATAGNTTAMITGWNLATLTVLPPLHSDVDFTLVVTATATEGANGAVATTNANLAVTVSAVADAPTLTVNPAAGNEDAAIALTVATALVDTDGSETLSITVSSIPVGATLSSGANTFTATAGNTTATITGWNLATLTVLPPLHSDVDFTLAVASTATEGANGAAATTTANLAVTVNAVADAPTLTVNAAAGNEDTAIALSVATALVDTDGSEALAITVSSIPVGATLSSGANTFTATAGNTTATITGWNLAGLTVLPPLHSDADFTLVVASTATEGANGAVATTNANLAVTVAAVADAPTLTVSPAAGNEDTAIALSVATALVDTDGSETLAITVSAIPIGAVITDGVNTFTASAGNQAVNVTGWNLPALTVTPPADADADFTLTLTAAATEGANGSVAASVAGLAVDVLPVNDAPTVAAPAALDVVEDVASPLLGISFGDVDAGAGLVTATFTVAQGTLSATAGGGVAVGGTATARTLTGTLAGINAFLAGGGLGYTTVLDGNAPVALTASLDDLGNTGAGGPLASPNGNVTLNVIPVNDAPVLGGVALEIDAGGTVVLTGANMSATDVDDAPPSLVFFIAGLRNGRFELAGNPGVPVLTFTQAQVTAGEVKFVNTDPLRAPSYLVFVTDRASTVGPGIVALTFRPLYEPGGASKGARDDGGLPTIGFASRAVDTSGAGLSDPFAIRFNRPAVVPTEGGDAAIAEAEAVTPVAGSRLALGTPGSVFEVRSRGIAYPDLGFGEMDKLATKIPPLDFGIGPQRPHEEPRGLALALEAVRTAGLVVSVGAVWWASRAAGLVSSLLAITPTWRHMDPLPVLGSDQDEAAGGWDDPVSEEAAKEDASANEMFDAKAKSPPPA